MGDISYGLYLIHVPTLMFFNALFVSPDADPFSERPLVGTLIAIAVSIIVALLSARFFEQPARNAIRERSTVVPLHRMVQDFSRSR
jgi:peptidoglycan/LPS O-acetylase OafA/YrhL